VRFPNSPVVIFCSTFESPFITECLLLLLYCYACAGVKELLSDVTGMNKDASFRDQEVPWIVTSGNVNMRTTKVCGLTQTGTNCYLII